MQEKQMNYAQMNIINNYTNTSNDNDILPSYRHFYATQANKRINLKKDFEINDKKIFKECPCTYDHKLSYEGRLIISENYVSFISNSLARLCKICIPFREITSLEKGNKALVIPNVIRLFGSNNKEYNFSSLWQRDEIFLILLKLWKRSTVIELYGPRLANNLEFASDNMAELEMKIKLENIPIMVDAITYNIAENLKLEANDALIDFFTCTYEEDHSISNGRICVTSLNIIFQKTLSSSSSSSAATNSPFLRAHSLSIPLSDITLIENSNIPTSIKIFSRSKRYEFGSFVNRQNAIEVMTSVWKINHPGIEFTELGSLPRSLEKKFTPKSDEEESPIRNRNETSFMKTLSLSYDDIPDGIFLDEYGFDIPKNLIKEYLSSKKEFEKKLVKQRIYWNQFLANNNLDHHIHNRSSVLLKAIKKGIPFDSRGYVWLKLSGAKEKMNSTENYSPTYYLQLTKQFCYCSSEISKDLVRTFPYHPYYKKEENLKKLERVLVAYANRNPSVGYCQSMNFISGILLLFLSEENTFWVLCTLAEDRLSDYFSSWMIGSVVDIKVLEEFISEKSPKLHQHITQYNFPLSMISTKWFMCLFIGSFPTETLLRIWDLFFLIGSPIIFSIALSLMKRFEDELISISDIGDFVIRLTQLGKNIFQADSLIKYAFKTMGVIEIKTLNSIRSRFWVEVEVQLTDENRRRDFALLCKTSHFKLEELEEWYGRFSIEKIKSTQGQSKYTARCLSIGIDYFSFEKMISYIAPHWNIPEATNLLHRYFRSLDHNHDLVITFQELMNGLSKMFRGTEKEILILLFDMYKKDNFVYAEDFYQLATSLFQIHYPNDDYVFDEITNLFGKNFEKLNFAEFSTTLLSNLNLRNALFPPAQTLIGNSATRKRSFSDIGKIPEK